MSKKRYNPEEIVIKLRQVEVLQSQGMVVSDAIRQIGVSEVTYYRWRKEYCGMAIHQYETSEGSRQGESTTAQSSIRFDVG